MTNNQYVDLQLSYNNIFLFIEDDIVGGQACMEIGEESTRKLWKIQLKPTITSQKSVWMQRNFWQSPRLFLSTNSSNSI